MTVRLTRRRALTVLAAAAGVPLLLRAGGAQARLVRWEGSALGAQASIQLYHTDEAAARDAIAAAVAEVERLEAIFSLYRADSVLATLNRLGSVDGAPAEFIELVTSALGYSELSGGAFDPTVQPLWNVYFGHFTAPGADGSGPSAQAVEQARALVGWHRVAVDAGAGRVAFARPGMGMTLNGIAQGYITDRVAAALRARGFDRTLVDMGEPRALAAKPDGSAWRIGIADPKTPARAITEVEVVDQAVATSGGYGTSFDEGQRFTHLIDPRTGLTAPAAAGVTVIADGAAKADALSTALAIAAPERRQAIISAGGAQRALFVSPDGQVTSVSA